MADPLDLSTIEARLAAAREARGLDGETTFRFVGMCPVEVVELLTHAPTYLAALAAKETPT